MKCDNLLHKFKLSPSILAADFTRIGEMVETAEKAGVDYIHIDVMDGHFVKPITMGEKMLSAIRNITKLPLDIHMMVNHPENHYKSFIDAGADLLTVHIESLCDINSLILEIKQYPVQVSVAVKPQTSLKTIENILDQLDGVLIMTVEPGYSGQPFLHFMLPKIKKLHQMLEHVGLDIEIGVDGGIDADTAPLVYASGARMLVAGSAIYTPGLLIEDGVNSIRSSIVIE